MYAVIVAGTVFLALCAAGLFGLALHKSLPPHHLEGDSRSAIQLVMGLVATMAALALSLLISSANTAYTTQRVEMQQLAANIVQVDRLLAHYGPEAAPARAALKHNVQEALRRFATGAPAAPPQPASEADALYDAEQNLTPHTDPQRFGQARVLQLLAELAQTRLVMAEQVRGAVSWPFLAGLIFWLAALFVGFGLFVRRNATVVAALAVGALSVSGAIFLILELNNPYGGFIRLAVDPVRAAAAQLNR